MKKIVLILTVLATTIGYSQEIKWVTLEEAIELQKKAPRKIIMDVYTNWCGPCKLLDKKTFKNVDVANYINTHYYAVKFNAEGNDKINYNGNTYTNPGFDASRVNKRNSAHQLTRFLRVAAYPTLVFFDESGNVIAPIRGYQTPQQIELYLKLFKSDEYLQMTTKEKFQAYANAFKAEFKG